MSAVAVESEVWETRKEEAAAETETETDMAEADGAPSVLSSLWWLARLQPMILLLPSAI